VDTFVDTFFVVVVDEVAIGGGPAVDSSPFVANLIRRDVGEGATI
jgi:hypothetical protein